METAVKIQIKSKWSDRIVFECEIEAGEDAPLGVRIGMAVKIAIGQKADLSGAVLRDADFSQNPAAEPFAELARRNRSVGVSGRRVAFVRKLVEPTDANACNGCGRLLWNADHEKETGRSL